MRAWLVVLGLLAIAGCTAPGASGRQSSAALQNVIPAPTPTMATGSITFQ